MNILTNIIYWAFSVYYWKDYMQCRKIKEILTYFFEGEESIELQRKFEENFDYPPNMTNMPVRYENDTGTIYYILNFKSKELYENIGTRDVAYTNSLRILDKYLPIGVTAYLEPVELMSVPESPYSIFCSFRPVTDTSRNKTFINLLKTILSGLVFIYILGLLFFGFYKIFLLFF